MLLVGLSLLWFFATYLVFDGKSLTRFQRGFIGSAPVALLWLAASITDYL